MRSAARRAPRPDALPGPARSPARRAPRPWSRRSPELGRPSTTRLRTQPPGGERSERTRSMRSAVHSPRPPHHVPVRAPGLAIAPASTWPETDHGARRGQDPDARPPCQERMGPTGSATVPGKWMGPDIPPGARSMYGLADLASLPGARVGPKNLTWRCPASTDRAGGSVRLPLVAPGDRWPTANPAAGPVTVRSPPASACARLMVLRPVRGGGRRGPGDSRPSRARPRSREGREPRRRSASRPGIG